MIRLEHFSKYEHEFVRKVNDWIYHVDTAYKTKKTKFLTPREQQIVQVLVNEFEGVKVHFDGGFSNAERKRAIITPSYFSDEDFEELVKGYELKHHQFIILEHRQVLGSLTSLNIDRAIIGDIVITETNKVYVAICEEFDAFMKQYFTQVGRHPITLIEADLQSVQKMEQYEEHEYIISSMRLDVVAASVMKLSRAKVSESIKQGNIQLNFKTEQNHSVTCNIGDILSIKRYGRYKLLAQKTLTKSGKIIVIIGKIV
ncbi:MAG: RNA-binding protein [Turicibacter sp.]|nr:RNA-binding protein [Turicibacter sp.]